MYCILIAGIPAAGKTTLAEALSQLLGLPYFSKDAIKELLFDGIGFRSRAEKVNLGAVSTDLLYYAAEQLMRRNQPFLLENNFEFSSQGALLSLLERYSYTAITVTLTGDYPTIYRRFLQRNQSPQRHLGHVVNDCYPVKPSSKPVPPLSYEDFVWGIHHRGMDQFTANGPRLTVDTTDLSAVDPAQLAEQLRTLSKGLL